MKLKRLGSLIKHGSAKDIYRVSKEDIAFRFTDHFSVFDVGRARQTIPGKGAAVCACAVKSFHIAEAIGVPTHFVEQMDEVTIRVKEARIIVDRNLTTLDKNYVVPAKLIYRLRVAGSILRDFKADKKKPENYGLPAGIIPTEGTPFPYPIHHCTTKFEDFDRDLTNAGVCELAGITLDDQNQYWSMIDRLTGAMALELASAGFALLDGKMEVLMGHGRIKLVGDVFGTPDEDRFVPLAKLRGGVVEHYSKEFIRQYLIGIGYKERLDKARAAEKNDPPIPRLPDNILAEVVQRYKIVAEAYARVKL